MGNYNPHIPLIIGQEWAPIREEEILYDLNVNTFEQGHTFTTDGDNTLQDARFYITNPPENFFERQVYTIAIYPEGTEDNTGPIKSVIIPCNNGGITGAGASFSGGATTVAQALQDPSHETAILIQSGNGVQNDVSIFFAVNQYGPLLYNKRILGVKFLYGLEQNFGDAHVALDSYIMNNVLNTQWRYPDLSTFPYFKPLSVDSNGIVGRISEISLGDTNVYFTDPSTLNESIPWTYTSLQRFEATSGVTRLHVHLRTISDPSDGDDYFLAYGALQVFYCEEQRVAYGSKIFNSSATAEVFYLRNTNVITMRDLAGTTSPVLPLGNYTVTLAQSSVGDSALAALNAGPQPMVTALRQLYEIPGHHGVLIEKPRLTDASDGETFTVSDTDILPQLSIHSSSGPLTAPHVYGRQAVAQVYGTVTATQNVYDSFAVFPAEYPQVRFYGRRFGDTTKNLTLSSAAFPSSTATITPAEFDALEEIVDGWKEITLDFSTPPTLGTGTNPTWTWSATGELAGNRWEILGTYAPALSGVPGNLFNKIPAPHQLSEATYGAPLDGETIRLAWIPGYSPLVSGTTADETADAVLLFSQEMPVISGLGVTVESQEIVGIGLNCGINPCCVPSALSYNQITWDAPQVDYMASNFDDFERTESNGWGAMTTGQTWNESGGLVADYNVAGGVGTMTIATVDVDRYQLSLSTDIQGRLTEMVTTMSIDQVPTGGAVTTTQVWRWEDASNNLRVDLTWGTDQSLQLSINSRIAVAGTAIGSTYTGLASFSANDRVIVRSRVEDNLVMAKAWHEGDPEPLDWQVEGYIPTDQPFANSVGVRSYAAATNTNVGLIAAFDNFSYGIPREMTIELQRMDTVETEWKTIMMATNLAISGFNDYEARVGIVSSYRARMVNVYNFTGDWSVTVSSEIPAPGVTIGCDEGHLLIFTSNEAQDGSLNLAYSSVWEGRVEEDFTFPEASFVRLQAMYGRDFFTAFRPTERGGDQFQRTVLVQAAAIAPETLADFTSLRDMAWADVSYICVRDEDGNRWLATILVPSAKVTHFRKLYLAPVEIIEVTEIPSQVNP